MTAQDQHPTNQGPLSGIEVRDPCPYCGDRQMIPRTLFREHIARLHPDVREGPATDGGLRAPRSFAERIRRQLVLRGVPERHADWYLDGFRAETPVPTAAAPDDTLRCVCGDPVEWMDHPLDGQGWIHSPGSDTPCLTARPRCPHCQLPHLLSRAMAAVCASIRADIAARAPAPGGGLRDAIHAALLAEWHSYAEDQRPRSPSEHCWGFADAVLAVRDRELEQARAEAAELHESRRQYARKLADYTKRTLQAEAAIKRAREIAQHPSEPIPEAVADAIRIALDTPPEKP